MGLPERFEDATVNVKANVYFGGKVVSHTVVLKDGSKKTLGLIYPGSYSFNTGDPERMDIVAGACRVKLPGQGAWKDCRAGGFFDVPGNSSFEIVVDEGVAEYVCSFG